MDAGIAFRAQADTCAELGSPMYADLLRVLADDLDAGGPTRGMLRDHGDDPARSALGLRILGGVHRIVLERRADALAIVYPTVGGRYDAALAAPLLREVVEQHADELAAGLDRPPQTNEVGRAVALYAGLVSLPWDLPVRLVELGCSAGLNLRADRFGFGTERGVVGESSSFVRIDDAWRNGPPGRRVRVVGRWGCDLDPVDVTGDEGRMTLSSFVWADQLERWKRLKAALVVTSQVPATVVRGDVVDVMEQLELVEGTATVVWHSVMRQYLPSSRAVALDAAVEEVGAGATPAAPLALVTLEPQLDEGPRPDRYPVVLTTWPGRERRVLGHAAPHGPPMVWV